MDPDRAFQQIWQRQQVSAPHLQVITDQIRAVPDSSATRLLAKLTSRFPEACKAAVELASDADPLVRRTALRCVYEATVKTTAVQILSRLITDMNETVVEAAAWRAAELHFRELHPLIVERIKTVADPECANRTRQTADVLHAGYVVDHESAEYVGVIMLCRGGIVSTTIGRDEVQRSGIAEAVKTRWAWF